jgi:hypothetical protein
VSLDTPRPMVLHVAMRLTPSAPSRDGRRGVASRGGAAERAAAASRTKPIGLADRAMTQLRIDLEQLSPADRRDLANALLRAAWSAALNEVRILLLDLLTEVDDVLLADPR